MVLSYRCFICCSGCRLVFVDYCPLLIVVLVYLNVLRMVGVLCIGLAVLLVWVGVCLFVAVGFGLGWFTCCGC